MSLTAAPPPSLPPGGQAEAARALLPPPLAELLASAAATPRAAASGSAAAASDGTPAGGGAAEGGGGGLAELRGVLPSALPPELAALLAEASPLLSALAWPLRPPLTALRRLLPLLLGRRGGGAGARAGGGGASRPAPGCPDLRPFLANAEKHGAELRRMRVGPRPQHRPITAA
jgi:hypothetical protein